MTRKDSETIVVTPDGTPAPTAPTTGTPTTGTPGAVTPAPRSGERPIQDARGVPNLTPGASTGDDVQTDPAPPRVGAPRAGDQPLTTAPDAGDVLLDVRGLQKYFPIKGGLFSRVVANVKAVDDVSFHAHRGEVVGIVGESGSGKTTAGRSLLRLVEPTGGEVIFDGVDLTKLSNQEMRKYRREMQIIFQDPFASLNPRMTVADIIGEAYQIHGLYPGKERTDRIAELLKKVGMVPESMGRYPHEFSGGQRQRIGIARALAVDPALIVADEPVSALDVSIQAQVVNLLQDLQEEMGLTILFIAHDLAIVEYICDRIVVMYCGKVMEIAPAIDLYRNPKHPYTEALLSAAPVPDPTVKRQRIILEGDVPSQINPPSGCVFRTRCRYAIDECAQVVPPLVEVAPRHFKACIRDDIL